MPDKTSTPFEMGKSKAAKAAKSAAKETEVKALSSVKGAAVTKPSQTPKSQSKELAKQVAAKNDTLDKKSKKVKKEPTPIPSSGSESESDSDEAMSSASSGSSDEEVAVATSKANVVATNGLSKAADGDTSESSESSEDELKASAFARAPATDSEDDSDEGSDDDSEIEGKKGDEAAIDADSEDDSSEDDDEAIEAPGAVDAKALNGKLERVASKEASAAASSNGSDDSASDSAAAGASGSDSDSDSSDDEEEEPAPSKKRKADTEPAPVAKKVKADAMAASIEDMGKANLFVGNLSWNVDEDWLVREFEKFGEIKGTRIVTDKESGRSRGFGYVEFVNYADGIKAHDEMQDAIIDGRTVNIDVAGPKKEKADGDFQDRSKRYGDNTNPPSTTIFCANLAFGATQDDVSDAFGEHAEIKAVRIPTDPGTGQMKGFAYVEFNSIEDATTAFEAMKGASIQGRTIRVDYATTGGNNSGGRGRGRGGFDRGGRGFDRGGRGGDRGGRGGRGRGGFDRGGGRGGRGGSTNRGGFGDFKGKKMTF
ncbi:MAG: hypothetical protein Q9218_006661 [Villophora microphyllina]